MKSWIIFFSQLALVVGLAGVVFWVMPAQFYFLVGAVLSVVTAGLMSSASENLERTLDWWLMLIVWSALFGAFWPTLPIVVAWGAAKQRALVRSTPAAKDSPPTSGPADSAGPEGS